MGSDTEQVRRPRRGPRAPVRAVLAVGAHGSQPLCDR